MTAAKKSSNATTTGIRIAAVDAYIAGAAPFAQEILLYLRDVMHEGAPGAIEEIKWSRPFFVYRGVILGNISAFKAHCSFGLWGTHLADKLREEGVASADGMGSFGKLAGIDQLPRRGKLVGYVREAAKKIAEGERTKAWSRPRVVKAEVEVPEALAASLSRNKTAATAWSATTPGCKREYCQWIAEAKREETRARRVAQAIEWIAQGRSRNWKYESPPKECSGAKKAAITKRGSTRVRGPLHP